MTRDVPDSHQAMESAETWLNHLRKTAGLGPATLLPSDAGELPPLPPGWCWVQLRELVSRIEAGKSPKALGRPAERDELGVLKVSAVSWGEFQPAENKALEFGFDAAGLPRVCAGDLLISRANTTELVGAVVMVKQDFPNLLLSDKTLRLVPVSPEISAGYLLYALRTRVVRRLFEQATGTSDSMRNLSQEKILAAPIALAPPQEQCRIVGRIEAMMGRIRQARMTIDPTRRLVKNYRAALYAEAFSGRLTEGFRNARPIESTDEVLRRVSVTQTSRKRSALESKVIKGRQAISVGNPGTPLPSGWEWVKMSDVAQLETGHTPSRNHPEYWGGPIPWVGIRDARAHHGGYISQTVQTVTELGLQNSAARLLPAGTVCLSRTASVGYVVIMGQPMATSQDFVDWICSSAVEPKYLMHALMAEGEDIKRFGEGSTHTTIYFPEVLAFHIALPPVEEQRKIVELLDRHLAAIDNIGNDRLDKLQEDLNRLVAAIVLSAFEGRL